MLIRDYTIRIKENKITTKDDKIKIKENKNNG